MEYSKITRIWAMHLNVNLDHSCLTSRHPNFNKSNMELTMGKLQKYQGIINLINCRIRKIFIRKTKLK